MSAMAFAPNDIAGLSASTGRKLPTATPQDADAEEDFSAALAQIADAAPTAGSAQQPARQLAPASGATAKADVAIWKEFSAFSGATAPVADAKAGTVLGQSGAVVKAKSLVVEDRTATGLARETEMEEETSSGVSARARAADSDLPATRGTISPRSEDTAKPSDRFQAKSAEEESSPKNLAAPKTANPSPAPAASPASNTPPAPLALPLAATAAAAPLVPAAAAPLPEPTGAADDEKEVQDAVARIGAALAGSGGAPAIRAFAEAEAQPEPQASPKEGATVSVHVVSQKTWLPPVSSPSHDLRRLSQDTAPQAPRVVVEKLAETGAKAALAGEARNSSLAALAEARSDTPSVLAGSTPAASLASPADDGAKPAAPAATAAPAPQTSGSAPTPRRDLEITLAPKDLGGLEVHMKSAGDRLELAFVTERGETARMISDKSVALESQLHGAGLGLGGIDISSAAAGQGGGAAPGVGKQTEPQPQASGGGESDQPPQSQTPSDRDRQERKDETQDQTGAPRSRGDRGLYL